MTFRGLDGRRWIILTVKFLSPWENGRSSPAVPLLCDLAVIPRRSIIIFPVLKAAAENDCCYFAMVDESWFFLQRASRRMWTLERADVLEKPRLTIQSRKLMFTIIWSPQGFHMVDSSPNSTTMSSTYFTDNVLTKTAAAFFPDGRRERSRTRTLHLHNCSVHESRTAENFMQQNGMECMPHPPY
jgi:hypothetical protein